VSEETEQKEGDAKENQDWFSTLLAPGVRTSNPMFRDYRLFVIDLQEFTGDKIQLIRGQAERAKAIFSRVAEREFPGVEYEFDETEVLSERKLIVYTKDGRRSSVVVFMGNFGAVELYIYTDRELESDARAALNELLFGYDP